MDPATLSPMSGVDPLTTGDWITGHLSSNGEWLAMHVWIGTHPETDLIQVMYTPTGEIVTQAQGRLADLIGVGDDGVIYVESHLRSLGRVRMLAPGSTRFETAVEDLPAGFQAWRSGLIDHRRLGWWGILGGSLAEPVAGVVVTDLETGEVTSHAAEGITIGDVDQIVLDDWVVSETVVPAVAWDGAGDRAWIVHADQDAVTVLDLATGETELHYWSPPSSWIDSLLARLIPPARAKGPSSYGIQRSALVDPSGETLYVGTTVSEVVVDGEEWFIESVPVGIVAIDVVTWELIGSWEIPASEIVLSPDARFLVATGTTWTESLRTSDVRTEGIFAIETDSKELARRFDPPDAWPDVQFSPDGNFMYLGTQGGGRYDIVDLGAMQPVGGAHGSLLGGSFLVTTLRP